MEGKLPTKLLFPELSRSFVNVLMAEVCEGAPAPPPVPPLRARSDEDRDLSFEPEVFVADGKHLNANALFKHRGHGQYSRHAFPTGAGRSRPPRGAVQHETIFVDGSRHTVYISQPVRQSCPGTPPGPSRKGHKSDARARHRTQAISEARAAKYAS